MKKIIQLLSAILLFSSCTIVSRYIRYGEADIDDSKVFAQYVFKENSDKYFFNKKSNSVLDTILFKNNRGELQNLKTILDSTSTRAFVVIQNDSVLFEEYFNGYNNQDFSTIFSASKSVTSLLIGIAIDEGFIKNTNDPVTKYIKELRDADPMFGELTIRHLLDMRSGIKFNESYSNPLSWMARLYYGTNQLGKIKRMHFKCKPGTSHEYQSVSTAILGIVLEKATRQNLAKYFEDKVWKPLGMQNRGSWSLDDKKHKSAKSYCGLNISAIDLAKIGTLYVNKGKFGGKQIVSEKWITETISLNTQNGGGYKNQWYNECYEGEDSLGNIFFKDSTDVIKLYRKKYAHKSVKGTMLRVTPKGYKKWYREKYMWKDMNEYRYALKVYPGTNSAVGIMGQILYVDPKNKTVIVRLGDTKDWEYEQIMLKITEVLQEI